MTDGLRLGANAAEQAACFGLCLAVGLAAGVFALLYLRKAKPVERDLTDFFATVCLALGYVACMQFFLSGKPEPYGLLAYALGASVLPTAVFKLRKLWAKRSKKPKS